MSEPKNTRFTFQNKSEKEANLVDLAVILFLRPYPSSPLTSQCVTWSSTKQDSKDILNVVLFRSHNCREANTISVSNDGFLPLSLTIYRSLSPFWLENFFNSCNCVQIVNHLIWYFRETDSRNDGPWCQVFTYMSSDWRHFLGNM